MATQTRTALKAWFETGDIPTEAQFADLIDSIPNIKDDMDDAPANIQFIKKNIPTASVLTLNATPIEIVPAPGAGYFIEILNATFRIVFNTTPYATTNAINLQFPGSDLALYAHSNLLNSSKSLMKPFIKTTSFAVDIDIILENTKFEAIAPGANPTAGDSDIDIYITYRKTTI